MLVTLEDSLSLKLYQSHKQVLAMKIYAIMLYEDLEPNSQILNELKEDEALLISSESGSAPIVVSKDYLEKHKPERGGYYVKYEDGYESWSPAEAFEDGYTLVVEKKEIKSDV